MTSQITGFDIGQKALKMVHFNKGVPVKAVTVELPEEMMLNGQIAQPEALADFISVTAKKYGMPKKAAAVILPTALCYARTVTVPAMTEKQLKYNLPYEFSDYLSDDRSMFNFDFEVLEDIPDENGQVKEQRVFACTAAKSLLEGYKAMFKRAGYTLSVIVPEEYIFSRLCRGELGKEELAHKVFALVDLGQTATGIHILRHGQYDNKRTVDLSIDDVEKNITRETGYELHRTDAAMPELLSALSLPSSMELYNRMAIEIMKAINFYNYNNRDTDLQDIYLMGGGAAIEPLVATIRQVTGLNICPVSDLLPADMQTEEPELYLRAICCAGKE